MAHSTQQHYLDTGYQHADPTVQPVHSEFSPQPADTEGGSGDTTVEHVYPGTTMHFEEVGCCCSDVTVEPVNSEACVQLEETGCFSSDTKVQPVCDTTTQFAEIHYQSEDVTVVPVHSDTISQFEETGDGRGDVTVQQVYPGASIVFIETEECLPDDSDYTGNMDICETVEVEVSNNVDTDPLPDILSVQVPQVPESNCGDIEVDECIEMDATFGSVEMEVIVEEDEEQVEAEMESVEVLGEVEVSSVDVSIEAVSMPCADMPPSATIVEVAADTGIENSYVLEPAETSSVGVSAETVFRSCTESSPAKTVEGLSIEEDHTNPLSWEKCERTANAENSDVESVSDSRYSSMALAGAVIAAEESCASRDTDCEEGGISVDLADTHQNADLNKKLPATEKYSGKQEETPHSETLLDWAFSLQQADQASPQPSQHPKAKNQTEDLLVVQHDHLRPDVPNQIKTDFSESCTAASEKGRGNLSSAVFPGLSEEVQSMSTEVEACCVESHVGITSGDQNAAKEPIYLEKTSARQMERHNEDYPNSTTIHLPARVSFETDIPTSSQTQKVLDINGDEEFLEHTAESVESLETNNDNLSTPADGVDRENRGEEGENKTMKYVNEQTESCCGLKEKADTSKQGRDSTEQHREERETGWQKIDRDTLWGKQSVQKSKEIVMKDNQVQRSAEYSKDDVEKATEPTQAELEEKTVVIEEFPEDKCDLHSNKEHVRTEVVIAECFTKQDQEKVTEIATSACGRKDEEDKGTSNTGVTDKSIPEQTETAKTVTTADLNKETEMEQDLKAVKYSTNTSVGETGANWRTIDKQRGLDGHVANTAEDTHSAEQQDIESDKSRGTETEWQSVAEENSSVLQVASEINSTQKEKSKLAECSKTKCLSKDQICAAEEKTYGVVFAVDTQFNEHQTETVRTELETCVNKEKEVRVEVENTIENMATMYCVAEDASCADQRMGSEQTVQKQIVEEQRAEKAGSGRQNINVDRKHTEVAQMDLDTAEDGVKRLVRTEIKCVPKQIKMKNAIPETKGLASLEENCAETCRDKSDSSRTVEEQETETEIFSEVGRTAEQTMDTKITATKRNCANGEYPNTTGLVTDGQNATVNLMDAAKTAVSHSALTQNRGLTEEPSIQVHIASSHGFHSSYGSFHEVATTNPRCVPVNITSESSTGRGEDATGGEEQAETDDTTETKTDEFEIVTEQTAAQRSITQPDMNTTETITKTGEQQMKHPQISVSIKCTADKEMPPAGVAVERGSTSSQVLDISDSVVEKLNTDMCTETDSINPAQDNQNICFEPVGIKRLESINSISKESEDSISDRSEEQTCSVKSQCSTKSLDNVSLGKDVPKTGNCEEGDGTKQHFKNTDVLTKPQNKTVDCAYNKSMDEENPKINTNSKDNATQGQPTTPMECDCELSPSPQQIAQVASCILREKPRNLHKETPQDCYKTDHSIDRLEEDAHGVRKDDDGLFSDQCNEVNDEFLSADLGKNYQNSTDNQKHDTSGLMQNYGSADRNDKTNNHIADTEKENLTVEGKDEKNNVADVEKEKAVDVKHFENTDVLKRKVTETVFFDETNKNDDECDRNSKDRVKCTEMCDRQVKEKWGKVCKNVGENPHGTDRCVRNTTNEVIMNVSTNDDRSKESDVQNSDTVTRAVEEDGRWHKTSKIKDKVERNETDRNTDSENVCSTGGNMKTTDTRTSEESFEQNETNVSMWTDHNSHLVDQDDVQVRCDRNGERRDSIAEQISNHRDEQFNTHDNSIHDKNNEKINTADKQSDDENSEGMETTNDNLTCPRSVESDMSNTTTSSKDEVQARAMSFNKYSNTGDDDVDNNYNDKFISKENENGSSQEASMLTLLPSRADKNPGNDSADVDPHLSDANSSKSAETLTTKQKITQLPSPSTREQEDVCFCETSAPENGTLECYKVSTTEDTLTSSCATTKWDTMTVSTVEQKPEHLCGVSISKLKLGSLCDPLVSEQENVSPEQTSASKQESSSSKSIAQQSYDGIEIISTSEQESVNIENASLIERESVILAQTSKDEQKSIYFETSRTQRELTKPEEISADKSKSVLAADHDSFWHEQTSTVREKCVRGEETCRTGHENVNCEQTLVTTQQSIRSEKTSRFQLEVLDPRETIMIEQESVNPEDPSVTAHELPSPENASITQQDSINPAKDSTPKVYAIPQEIPGPQHDTFSLKETTTAHEFTNPESITTIQEFVNIDKTSAAEQNFVNTKDTPANKQELISDEKVSVTEQEFFSLEKTSTGFQESSSLEETSTTEDKNRHERKLVNALGSDKPQETSRTQQHSVIPEETSTDQQEPVHPKGNSTNQQKFNRPEDTLTTQKWPEDSSTAQQELFNLQQTLITEQEYFSAGNISRIQQDSTDTEEISTTHKKSVIPERTSINQQEYEKTSTTLHKPIIPKETTAAKQQSVGPDETAPAQKESFSPEETLTTEEANVSLKGTSTTLQKSILYKETSIPELQSATTEGTSATQNESVSPDKTSTTQQQYCSPENTSATVQTFGSRENSLTTQKESDSSENTLTTQKESDSSENTLTTQKESDSSEETSETGQENVNPTEASASQLESVDPEETSRILLESVSLGDPSTAEQKSVSSKETITEEFSVIQPESVNTEEASAAQRESIIFKETSTQQKSVDLNGASTTQKILVDPEGSSTSDHKFSTPGYPSPTEQQHVCSREIPKSQKESISPGKTSTAEQASLNPREILQIQQRSGLILKPQHEPVGFRGSSTNERESVREQSSTTKQDSVIEQNSTTQQEPSRLEQNSATEQQSNRPEQNSATEQQSNRPEQNSATEQAWVSTGETLTAEHESIGPEESSTSQQESINKETSKTMKESSMPEDISTAQLNSVRCEETLVTDDVPISSEEALVTQWRSTDPGEKSVTEEDSVSSEDASRTEQELCYVYEASAPEHKLVITLRTHSGKSDVKGPVHKRYEKNEEHGSDSDTEETENTDDLDSEKNAELYNTTTDSCDSFQVCHTNFSVNQSGKRKYSSILSDNPNTDYKQSYQNKSSASDTDDKSSTKRDGEHEGLSLKEINGAQDFESTPHIKRTKRPQESDSAETSFQSSFPIPSFTSVSSVSSKVVPLSQNARKHSKKRRRKSRKTKSKKQVYECSSPMRDETQTFSCGSCSETFTNKLQYCRHERQHSFNHCFVCEVCGARLTSDEDGYRSHLQQHSRRELLRFSCLSCGQPFSSKEQLDQHTALHPCPPPSSPHTTPPTPNPAMLVEAPSPPLREPSCMRIVLSKTGKTSRKRKRRSRDAEDGLSFPERAGGDQGCTHPQEAGQKCEDAHSGWASVGKDAGRSPPTTADHKEIPTSPLTSAGRKSLRKKFPSRSRCSCCPDLSTAFFPFHFASEHGFVDATERSKDRAAMLKTVSDRETVSLMHDVHHLNGDENGSVLRQTVMDPVPKVSIERLSFAVNNNNNNNNSNNNNLNGHAKESVMPERFSVANNNNYNNNNNNSSSSSNNNNNNDLNGHSKDSAMPQACPAFPLKDCSVQVWRLPQDVCFNGGLTMSGELCHSQASLDSELTSSDLPDSCEVPSNITPAPPLQKPCSVRIERMPRSWLRSLGSHSVLKLPSAESPEVLSLTAQQSQLLPPHMLASEENPEQRDSTQILKKNSTWKRQQSSSSSSQSKKRPAEQSQQRPAKIYRTASEKMLPQNLAFSHVQKRRRWREKRSVASGNKTPSLPKTQQREDLEGRGVFHRRYPCVFCERVFHCSSDMKTHINTHLGKTVTHVSRTNTSLPLPAELVEADPQPGVCHRCGFLASDSADLLRHMALHPAKTHACQHCRLTFHTLETLRCHMKAHTPSAQTFPEAARGGQRRRKKREGWRRGITTST